MSELCHYGRGNMLNWRGGGEDYNEQCALDADGFRSVPISPCAMEGPKMLFWHRYKLKRKLFRLSTGTS